MTAEFNSYGPPLSVDNPRSLPVSDSRPAIRSYKAVVMMFWAGGADTYNMLVPTCPSLYEQYKVTRTDLVLTNDEMIAINTTGQTRSNCSDYGLHNAYSFIAELYNQGDAAF